VPEPSIQSCDLTNQSTQKYREAFNSHPARLVVIKDFLLLDVAQRLSRFLAQEAIFVPEYGLYSSKNAVDEKQFLAAADPDRFFRYSKLTGKAPGFEMSQMPLRTSDFANYFSNRTSGFF
jgi:hypothetical protein